MGTGSPQAEPRSGVSYDCGASLEAVLASSADPRFLVDEMKQVRQFQWALLVLFFVAGAGSILVASGGPDRLGDLRRLKPLERAEVFSYLGKPCVDLTYTFPGRAPGLDAEMEATRDRRMPRLARMVPVILASGEMAGWFPADHKLHVTAPLGLNGRLRHLLGL